MYNNLCGLRISKKTSLRILSENFSEKTINSTANSADVKITHLSMGIISLIQGPNRTHN